MLNFLNPNIILREVVDLVESGKPVKMVMPFSFMIAPNTWWILPYEPLVSISGQNVIVKRNVAKSKGRGTIKERWTEGDISIKIEGVFVNANFDLYPDAEVQILRELISRKEAIKIQNELLQMLNVNQIIIEKYDLPFSKGENVQNYSLEAVSDESYELFINMKKPNV